MQTRAPPPFRSPDPFDLGRFVDAQNPVWDEVLRELRSGAKRTHWMWFVFPQIAGLGRSDTARRFAIGSLGEAHAYLRHPVLGARLREATGLVLAARAQSARAIFGSPDDLKLRSCLTLFDRAMPEDVFAHALERFFAGPDSATLRALTEGDPT